MFGHDLVEALHGANLEKADPNSWRGCLEGRLAIENLSEERESLLFDVLLPTDESDVVDYIWSSELETGTTDKVVLVQEGELIEGARVVGVVREGKSERWTPAESEQYRVSLTCQSTPSAPTYRLRSTRGGLTTG